MADGEQDAPNRRAGSEETPRNAAAERQQGRAPSEAPAKKRSDEELEEARDPVVETLSQEEQVANPNLHFGSQAEAKDFKVAELAENEDPVAEAGEQAAQLAEPAPAEDLGSDEATAFDLGGTAGGDFGSLDGFTRGQVFSSGSPRRFRTETGQIEADSAVPSGGSGSTAASNPVPVGTADGGTGATNSSSSGGSGSGTASQLSLSGNAVDENAADGTVVGTISVDDPTPGETYSFALTGDAGGRFQIDAASGVITVADGSLLDYESAAAHTLMVQVSDSSGVIFSQSVSIALGDVNEASISAVTDSNIELNQVSESAADATAVGITALATDSDGTDTVTYSLSDDAGGRFVIDAGSGVVRVADSSLLDYEATTAHNIEVTATSSDGSFTTQTFTVNLTDDTSESAVGAVTDNNAVANAVSEGAADGATVGITAAASDGDATDTVTYSLSDSAGGRFAIDANSGVVTVADSSLLDYESATAHSITVTATSSDGSTSNQAFTVSLTDDTSEASVSAVADSNAAANSVSESAANGTAVGITALATDADATDTVSYSLSDSAGGRFAIDSGSGVITVADGSLLDYETATSHTVEVTATSTDGSTSVQSFTINLTDDTAEAAVGPVSDSNTATNTISESTANGTAVGITALATDADGSDTVSYALSDSAGGRFAIDSSTGIVTVADNSLLDFEAATSHTLEVTATSTDGSTSVQSFTVNLTDDTSEAAVGPVSDSDAAANSISESAANGTAVGITALASDADASDTVSYSLSDSAGGRFAIDSSNGVITVADSSLLDFETATSHTVEVTATSTDGSTSVQSFTVNLTDDTSEAAVGAVLDSNAAANTVSESAANGTAVGITALATDADATDTVSYSLSDTAGGRFAIDSSSGVITVADSSLLDYETATNHTVEVTATSSDGSTSVQSFTVNLTDDNTESSVGAVSDSNAAANSISESAANGTAVGIAALATDADPSDTVTYSLSDNAGGRFTIDGSSGVISVADNSLLDYETTTSHTVEVTATSSDGSTSIQSFTVNLTDDTAEAAVGPVSDSNSAANTISESAANGTAVGITALASDADATDSVSYSLSDNAGGRFVIDSSSGVITVADNSLLDYETATSHTVEVTATSSDGSTSVQSFTVNLTDDTSESAVGAVSDSNVSANTVSESAADGTPVGITASASDADAGDTVSYALSDNAGGRFAIDGSSGVITVADSSLLDYETATSHTVEVTATSTDGSTSIQSFTINLTDDTAEAAVGPVTDSQGMANTVSESAANGSHVCITALATDADASDTVSYALSDSAGGRFAIDSTTGVVTVADTSLLDYETATSHTIEVTATSTDGSTSVQSFTINLTDDTSEAAVGAVSDSDSAANSVSENAANGTAVGVTALASDADASDTVSYALTDNAGGRFAIDGSSGVITVADNSLLDYETATSHTVEVTATSSDGSTSVQSFTVNLTDDTSEASVGAITDSNTAANSVAEDAANGTVVGVTALASDADATDTVSYSLSDSAGGRFAIDSSSGVVTVADSSLLDYETATSHTVEVTATSTDGSTSVQSFTINLQDASEVPVGAVSDSDAAANTVSESAANGTAVGVTALATDADSSDTVSYSLSDSAGGRFAIDSSTGVITVADNSLLDAETAASHTVEVTATSTDGSTSIQTFTINLSDDNSEFSVGAVTDSDGAANEVSENVSIGATVGLTAAASDADASDTVSYSLSDSAGGRFTIDSSSGVVSVADPSLLDYETTTSHTIEVTATSTDGSTSIQSFTINLLDASESGVGSISDTDGASEQVSESAANGTAVGLTAFATDPDGSDTVSYSLSDSAGGRFAIDASSGVVTVADSSLLDYETATSHTIEVTATSTDGSTNVRSFTINLTDDTSEASVGAVADSDVTANTISESAADGTAVGVTALASDADASDTVSYSLSDSAGGRFAIDSGSGVITVADSSLLDYETATSHTIEVTATSTDGSTSVQSFTINLTDDTSESAVGAVTDSNAAANSISESAANGTAVGVTALASDADSSDTVSYSLSDNAGGRFAIDGSTGVITVADNSLLDYETATSHTVEVTATSTDGSTSVQSFTINLTDDTSEAAVGPVTDSNASANSVSESAANGTAVGITATASDADATDTVSFSLSDSAGGRFAIDSSTGIVTVADNSLLDYETATSHTIEVTATSTDGSTSIQSFTINLADDTSEASVGAVSDSNAAANTVSESAVNGTAVGVTALASDADTTDTVSYSLTDNAGGRFAIDGGTGVITVADTSLLDYETATSHTVEVTATSSDGSTSVQSFTINLTDDTSESAVGAVSDSNATANTVSENAANGTAVGITASATDADATDTVSYALSDSAGGRFAIDSSSGVVTVADNSLLDYETATSHTIEVTATSTDGSTSVQTFTVNLSDDTSEASVGNITDSNVAANTISESAANGTAVGITALASDADATDTVSYTLSDSAGGRFAIDSSTGVITVADSSQLDYEAATSHTVEVTATSTDGSTSVQSFTINLTDDTSESSVGAVSDSNAAANSVSESAANGTAVGITALATDADATDTVSYSLSDTAGGRFAIDSSTGVITVADNSLLDYETATSHTVEVTATSSDGSTSVQSFTVNLSDDTSEASVGAVSDSNVTANTVSESAANGTAVGITALASDADATDTVSYTLSDSAGGRFAIDSSSGVITVADNSLLDYETATSHTVEVTATSTDGSTSVQTFTVNLTDDTSESSVGAVSDSNVGANSVSESAANGTAVGITALASDADATDTVSYSLSDSAGGRFAIDSSTGVVTVADNSLLDYETATSHTVEVTATSSDGSTSVQSFTINLTDDTSEASVGVVSDSNASANSVSESAANGTAVGITALASDADATDSVSYSLSDSAGGRFAIDSSTGVITVADSSLLDYETATSHTVEVTATSTDGSTSVQSFTVNLTDDTSEASVGPISDNNAGANSVSESAANGTAVGITALATDADATDTVSYTLSDSAGGRFAIDSSSGVITVSDNSLLDYETATSHTVEVTATSTDGSTSVQSFIINLTDDTSEASVGAVSDSDTASNTISESAANGTAVGVTALATDADATDSVSYSLSDTAGGRFTIDDSTGVITVADSSLLDYETATSHTVEVTATSTDGSTSVQSFTINLTDDTSEASVGGVSDSDTASNTISESAANGTAVGVTALATDADTTDSVSYSLSDSAGGRFAIDSSSGVITVADNSLLDYETATSHTVEVTATSTDGSTSVQTFTVNLTDDTSEAAVGAVSDSNATANSVSESAANGTAVGITALASDADATDTVSYSLSDSAGGRFAIDSSSGVITVADNSLLDFETTTSHTVEVTATSTDGSTSVQSFTINLTDDTSEASVGAIADSNVSANSVSESAANGTAVGVTALASDADATDSVSYTLSDSAGGRFAIDSSSGVITVADNSLLDYETATSHTVEVTATSTDGSTSVQSFTINLTDDTSEASVGAITDSNASGNSVSESAANGTAVGVTALATDADATDSVSYTLSDSAGGRFAIDGSTGVITVADNSLLDYETATSHTVEVTATSSDGSTSVQSFTINLTDDTSEAAVGAVSDSNVASNTISESAANGATVGITTLASDADATDSVSYTLSDSAGGRFAIDSSTGVVTVADSSLLDYETATSHTVEVTATSTDGSTSVQSFTVNLTDDTSESSVGAVSDSNATANSVSESAANGTAVGITALATDADGTDTVSYTLSDSAGGRFAIDSGSGVITVADSSLLDYETATSHTVEVTATSTDGSTSVQSFTINLTDDTSESAVGTVTDSNATANSVSESAANGTAVGVTALATDADATDTVSYSLSDSAGGRFAIDSSTGVITVADNSLLDYEAATSHTVEVTAISTDGSTSVQTFTVNLTDDTSEASVGAVSDSNATANSVSESAANGTAVGITALATDADATDTVSYSLSDSAGGRFAIDSGSGVITVADSSLLDFETATSHTVEVTATSTDGSTSVQSFTINLTDDTAEASVGAVSDSNAAANSVSESAANGTAVGITALATDADATDTVSYTLSDSAGGRFAIDSGSGVITVADNSLLDYETATSHTVEVTATSTDGSTSVQSFTINLTDDTSEAAVGAVSDSNISANSVSESAANGTAVGVTALATDADATDTVSYALSDSAGGRFAIDSSTGVITVADNSLLDYESATSHTVEVTATSTDGSTSVQSFTVNLTDDTSEASVGAVSDSNVSANSVSESAANGTAVGITALASDADATDTVSYSLSDSAGGRFAIDSSSGVITVADSSLLDYETATSHTVEVTATSTDGSTSVQTFTINLTDDYTEAAVGAVSDSNASANTVSESAANGTAVGITALATDADATDTVSYTLSDSAGGRFAIDSSSGVITVADNSLLDYETATSHTVEVTATSTDGSTSVQSFTVNLTDDTSESAVGAVSDSNATANSVSESAANGTAVGITALASDADATDTVSYSLSDSAGGRFAIDSSSGVITVADNSLLDYETATSHTVEVTATSTDGSTSVQSFTINLTDDTSESSVGAVSDSNASANSVSESAANGTAVGITALASDADATDTVSYTLSDSAGGRFAIDSSSGVITVADNSLLDYETATSHTVEVTATSTDGSTSVQSFTINLTDDTSESSVGAVSDSNASANSVSESAANGTAVGVTALATDADATDTVSYSLSDSAGGRFAIDSSSGVITVADNSLLDYETATSHTVEVTATSTDGSTSVQSFTINLTDDTSEASVGSISDSDATANTISESAANGTAVGVTALASDADATDTVSYTLSDSAGGRFAIDSSTGVVTVADTSLLDYETATSHTVEVTATSTDGSTSVQTFTINLTDDTSEASVGSISDSDATANTISESAANGTAVGVTALASDADATDTVSYTLSDSAGGRFAIDNSTGVITVADTSLLDYETATSHTVEVTATSSDGSTSVQTFTINLTDDTSEASVGAVSDSNASANSVSESAANGTAVGITALASDADATDTVSYTLSDSAGGRFAIDSSSGVITVADNSLLDYETATSHTVEVTATSSDGSTSIQSFTVNLTDDTSEASVGAVSDSNASANSVSESAANGTAVGITALASDADATDTVSYTLSDSAGGRFAIDGSTGVITVADNSLLDYETATSHTVEVTATSTDGSTSVQTFTVNLTDDTSEASVGAVSDSNATANSVSESAANGTAVGITALATDADATDTVSYSLSDSAGGRFAIDGSSGVITVADSSLLDYETATSHTVEVTATSTDGSTSVQTFTINLTDDTSEASVGAISDSNATANSVSESAANGTAVGVTALATDADGTDTVSYTLSDSAGGRFAIDSSTGVITIADNSLLDYETATSHTVEVTATSTDGSTSVQSFTINLTDDTSEAPVSAVSDSNATANTISESAANGTAVGITALATDADASDTVSYSLSDSAGGRFAIDSTTGVITVANSSLLDYETATSHTVEVTATSTDGSTSVQSFTVNLTDDTSEFSVGAVSDSDGTANSVSEDAANGTAVGITASASDGDASDTVSFTLSDDAGGRFAIDSSTGVVTVADNSLLDYETATSHNIEVTATSSDGSTSIQSFTVNLADANEAPTDLTVTGSSISLNEGGGNAHYFIADDGGAVVGGLTAFTIEVQFSASAPAVDDGVPLFSYHAGGASDEIELSAYNMPVSGGTVLQIEIGEDTHLIANEDVAWLFDGNDHQVSLTWDNTSGDWQIYLDGDLAYSGTGVATGHTIASGGEIVLGQEQSSLGGGFDSTQVLQGNLNDTRIFDDVRTAQEISDNAFSDVGASEPGLIVDWRMNDLNGGVVSDNVGSNDLSLGTASGAGFTTGTAPSLGTPSVVEGAANGTVVGVVDSVTDPDAGDTFTYALTDDAGGRFSIDASTGEISVADSSLLDYETATSHTVTVQVTDSGGLTYAEDVTISVAERNETPTDLTFEGNGALSASDGAGTTIATATAVDEDSGETHTFTLTDDAGGLFTIDSATGAISATSGNVSFSAQTGANNPFNGVDVGSYSAPTFADIDGDGDLDAFIGENAGNINYFENTGTSSSPIYTQRTGGNNPFNGVDIGSESAPTLADIDGDGDLDAFVGESDGTINYFENTGSSSSPTFTQRTGASNPFDGVDLGSYVSPDFADIDGDGDLDVLIGEDAGNINYFENTGTSGSPTFTQRTGASNPFDGVDVGTESAPAFVDMDGDGDLDVVVGEANGNLNYFENTGSSSSPTYTLQTGANNPFDGVDIGSYSTIEFADVDGDGDQDAFIGESDGTINYYQNDSSLDLTTLGSNTVTVQVEDSVGNTYSETVGINLGTSGDETLTGTANSDIIYGFDGADTINGGAGDDWLHGGSDGASSSGIDTSTGSETQSNTSTSGTQKDGAVAALQDGGYVVVWQDRAASEEQSGNVYAQRYDSDGNAVGSQITVGSYGGHDDNAVLFEVDVTGLAGGGFVVTWAEPTGDEAPTDVLGRVYDSSGTATGGEFTINGTSSNTQDAPAIAATTDGGFVAVWDGEGAGDTAGIFGQKYDSSGSAVGSEFLVNTTTTNTQSNPAVSALDDGGYIVVWEGRGSGDTTGIFGQRYDADGNASGGEFAVNTTTTNTQSEPAVITLLNGDFVVVWQSANQDGSGEGIFAQRFDSSGTALGSEFQVNDTTANDQSEPEIAALNDGGYMIVWQSDGQDGGGTGIYAKQYDSNGNEVSGETLVNSTTSGDQNSPDIDVLGNGNVVITWDGSGSGDSTGIYSHVYTDTSAGNGFATQVNSHSPVAYWRLGESSGTTVADETGSHNGTYDDGVSVGGASGPLSGETTVAADFDGVNDHIDIAHSSDFALADGTIQLWFNADASSGQYTLLSMESTSDTDGLNLRVKDDYLEFNLKGGGSDHFLTSSAGSISTGQWHHVAFTWGSGGMQLYLDGVLVDSDSYTGGLTDIGEAITIGASQKSSDDGSANNLEDFFDGQIAEVSVHDTALTSSEVNILIDSEANSPGASNFENLVNSHDPVAYWRLGDSSGTTAVDETGNLDGTYTNGVTLGSTGSSVGGSDTAAEFDGTDDYVFIGDDASLDLADGTIQLWFNADVVSGTQSLVSKDGSGSNAGDLDIWLQGNDLYAKVDDGSGSPYIITVSNVITADTWHHVAFSWGANGMELYLDGNLIGSDSYTGGIVGNDNPMLIGASGFGSTPGTIDGISDFFDGQIDEVSIHDSQLSASQISDLVNAGSGSGSGDTFDGGAGIDTVSYEGSNSGVAVDLDAGTANGGAADGDTLTSIENLTGSDHNDTLTGDSGANVLTGGLGDDTLSGGAGDDTLYGDAGDDTLTAGGGNDALYGGDGSDLFIFNEDASAYTATVSGGAGGGWTDVIELRDEVGGEPTAGWTYVLDSGSLDSSGADFLDLSDDAAGTITLADGSTIDFTGIERIEW